MINCIEKTFHLKLSRSQKNKIQQQDQQGHSNRIRFCKWLKTYLQIPLVEEEVWKKIKDNIGKFVKLNHSVKEVLLKLQMNYDLVLLTNGGEENQKKKIRHSGLYEFFPSNKIFISGALGYSKPDPRIFQTIEDRFPSTVQFYMIGDHLENDILGAMRFGWKAIFLNPNSQSIDNENVKAIANLLELKKALDEFRN